MRHVETWTYTRCCFERYARRTRAMRQSAARVYLCGSRAKRLRDIHACPPCVFTLLPRFDSYATFSAAITRCRYRPAYCRLRSAAMLAYYLMSMPYHTMLFHYAPPLLMLLNVQEEARASAGERA